MKIDYAQELSNIREQQHTAVDKLKESYEADLSNVKKTAKRKEKKLKRNQENQKEQLIKDNQDKIDLLSKRTNKLLEERRDSYLGDLTNQRKDFNQRRESLATGYRKKLQNISDSYEKSLKEHKYLDNLQRKNNTENFNTLIDTNKRNHNTQINELTSKSQDSIRDIRKQYSDREDDLVRSHRLEKDEMIRTSSDQLSGTKAFFNKKMDELRKSKDGEISRQEERFENSLEKTKSDGKLKLENQKDKFLTAITRLNNSSERERQLQEKENNQTITQLKREGEQDRYRFSRSLDEVRDRSIKGKGVEFQKRALRDSYESRLKGLQEQMTDQRSRFEVLKDDLEYDIATRSKSKDFMLRQKLDEKDQEHNSNFSNLMMSQRKKERSLVDEFQRKLQTQERTHQERSITKDNEFKDSVARQKQIYVDTLKKLNDANIRNVNNLQEEFAKEKSDISYLSSKLLKDTSTEQRQDYLEKVNKLMNKYEKLLSVKNYEFERMVEVKDQTIFNLKHNSKKELKAQQRFHKESKEINSSDSKARLDSQRVEYESRISAMKHKHDEEMARLKRESDLRISKVTNAYEDKLQQTTSETQTASKKKSNKHREELRRIVQQNKVRTEQLVANYERRIKEMKRAYELNRSSQTVRTRS
jgi:hypothetical protein